VYKFNNPDVGGAPPPHRDFRGPKADRKYIAQTFESTSNSDGFGCCRPAKDNEARIKYNSDVMVVSVHDETDLEDIPVHRKLGENTMYKNTVAYKSRETLREGDPVPHRDANWWKYGQTQTTRDEKMQTYNKDGQLIRVYNEDEMAKVAPYRKVGANKMGGTYTHSSESVGWCGAREQKAHLSESNAPHNHRWGNQTVTASEPENYKVREIPGSDDISGGAVHRPHGRHPCAPSSGWDYYA